MLPKINNATFSLNLPSNDEKKISYRSFLVKEEKILLIAKEDGSPKAMMNALKQIVTNCVIDEINIETMPLFDLEYIFLMIRSKSQNNKVQLKYNEPDNTSEYDAMFDYDKIEVLKNKDHNPIIDFDGNVGVVMRYPMISDLEKLGLFDTAESVNFSGSQAMELIKSCIESVYDSDNVYPWKEASQKEKDEFFDSLSGDYMNKIKNFFDTFPAIVGYIEYYKDKALITKEVRGIANFM